MSSPSPADPRSRDRAFAVVAQEVLDLYDRHQFAEALALAERAVEEFPDFSSRTTWFRACLLCRLGEFDAAIQVLKDGIDQGDWWSEDMLRSDGDLSQLQWHDDWEDLVARSVSLAEAAQEKSAPELRVIEPAAGATVDEPLPLLVALHGAGGLPDIGEHWELACDQGWLVAFPRSSRLISAGAPVWDDLAQARVEVEGHLADLRARYRVDVRRTVLAGFSQGGGAAVEVGVTGGLGVTGILAVAPWFDDLNRLVVHLSETERPPVYLVLGEKDRGLAGSSRAQATLTEAGFRCELAVHPGVGHGFPPDGDAVVKAALAVVGEPA